MSGGVATVGRLAVSVTGDLDELKTSMAEAKSVVGAAAKDMAVTVSSVSDSTDKVTAAGKRMVAALQEEVRTFGMSREEILIYKASLTGAGDEVARLVGQLQSLKAAQAAAPQVSADSQAAQRIRDMVAASVAQTAAMNESAGAVQNLTTAQAGAARVAASWADSQRLQAQNMAGVAASMRAATSGTQELSAQTQAIMNRYDPLGTKLRSLQSDLAVLRKEMGNSVDPAAMKAFEGLEKEIEKTHALMAKAGAEGFGAMESGAQKSALASAGATRELMVLGHEVISGNFSKIPGSIMVLAERMGSFGTLASAAGEFLLGVGGAATAAVGPLALVAAATYQAHQEFLELNQAIGLTSNYAGQTRDSINDLARQVGAAGQMTAGSAKEMVTAMVASGRIGGDAMASIAMLAANYARATGTSAEELTPKLIALFEDPKRGADELQRSMHLLTAAEVEHIRALEDTGQHQQAQLALAQQLGVHLALQTKEVSALAAAWHNVTNAASEFWQKAKDYYSSDDSYKVTLRAAQDTLAMMLNAPVDMSKQIEAQKKYIASLVAGHAAEQAASQQAAAAASADADRKKAISDELNKGALHRIELLKEEYALLKDAPNSAAVEQRKAELLDQIKSIQRSIGAEDRQLTQQQLTDGEQYNLLVLQGQAKRLENLLKLGTITKEQFDAAMTVNATEQNAVRQNYELQMSQVAGLTTAERQGHLDKLKYLREQASQIAENGRAALAIDEREIAKAYMSDLAKSGQATLDSLNAQIEKEAQHGREIGLTKAQIDALHSAQEQQATDELKGRELAIQVLLDNMDVNDKSLDQARKIYTELMAQIDAQIQARQTLANVMASNAIRDADAKAASEAAVAWKRTANTIENDMTNAIIDGGGRGWKKLVHDMEMAFARMILRPILQPLSQNFASFANPTVAGATGEQGFVGIAQGASSLYSSITGGMTASGELGTGFMGSLAGGLDGVTSGAAAARMGLTSDFGVSIGNSIASTVGPEVAGAISTGLGAVATALPWIGAAVAAVAIGKAAFGMGPKQTTSMGMSGTLSADSMTGQNYTDWVKKGGWFRSDQHGTDTTALSAQTVAQFTQGLQSLEASASGFASSLGVSADWLKTYSKDFNITLTGDAAKDQQAITDFFSGVGDEIANRLVPNLADFSKQGETAAATLQRLAGDFRATDQAMQMIGKTAAEEFGSSGMDSAKAREQLVNAFGGASSMTSLTQSYASDFLTNAQKIIPVQKALDAAMASMGLSSVKTIDQFNAVVSCLDLTTAAGAQEFASLMALEGAFKQVYAAGRTADQILSERQGLQDQYDQLTMTSAQLLDKQRAALDDSNKALFDQIQAIKAQATALQATKDAASTALSNVDSAFSVLQRVTKVTTDALSSRITAEKALSDAVKSTLSSMQASAVSLTDRAAAQAQIRSAVAIAKAGGPLPTADSLKDALSVVSKDASQQFSTYADYLKDLYSTKVDLSQLGNLADSSLSVDQQQLDSLNSMLAAQQQQIDLLKGIDVSSLTIAQALAGFKSSVGVAQANPIVGATQGIASLYQELLGRAPDAAGMQFWQESAAKGVSLDSMRANFMGSQEYKDHQHSLGVPGFANGGAFGGGWRLVGERGPELEATGPARIFNATQTSDLFSRLSSPSSNNDALVAEIKSLKQQLAEATAKNSAENTAVVKQLQAQVDLLTRVIYGGDSIQTKAVTS